MGIRKVEVTSITVTLEPYAQYRSAVAIDFVPNGKRKASRLVETSHPSALVLDGWGHPNPDSMWDESTRRIKGGVGAVEGRYSGFDPRWQSDFDAMIAKYIAGNPRVVVLADYRRHNAHNAIPSPESTPVTQRLAETAAGATDPGTRAAALGPATEDIDEGWEESSPPAAETRAPSPVRVPAPRGAASPAPALAGTHPVAGATRSGARARRRRRPRGDRRGVGGAALTGASAGVRRPVRHAPRTARVRRGRPRGRASACGRGSHRGRAPLADSRRRPGEGLHRGHGRGAPAEGRPA